jgi:uncharacterized membrane protein
MSDDRYAPPTAALGDPARERGTGRIDLGEAFREAWATLWANFGLMLGTWLLLLAVSLLSVVTVVGVLLVLPVLAWGMIRFVLNVTDGSGEVGDLFSGFSDYGRVLGTMLVFVILMALLYLVGQALSIVGRATGSGFIGLVGSAASLAWSLGVLARLVFAGFYVVDQGVAPVDALRTSWEATSEQKLNCLLLAILSFVIPVVGFLCLVVGVIPATMLVYLLQASAYRQLAGR